MLGSFWWESVRNIFSCPQCFTNRCLFYTKSTFVCDMVTRGVSKILWLMRFGPNLPFAEQSSVAEKWVLGSLPRFVAINKLLLLRNKNRKCIFQFRCLFYSKLVFIVLSSLDNSGSQKKSLLKTDAECVTFHFSPEIKILRMLLNFWRSCLLKIDSKCLLAIFLWESFFES